MKIFFRYLLIASIALYVSSCGMKKGALDEPIVFTAVSYNVENLFDTLDEYSTIDEEFTPLSEKLWNTERYQKKIESIAKVLSSIEKDELPELIGLMEVENKNVVTDLIHHPLLVVGNYGISYFESPDPRGIDVCLLYRKDQFRVLEEAPIAVQIPDSVNFKTRDILYVKGIASVSDTFHVFVNHWSSRRGGEVESEHKRVAAALILRNKVDEILSENPNAKILIMGDMNDMPDNKSIHESLMATNNIKPSNKQELYNLMYDKAMDGKGSYNYKGDWNMIDNIIVSQGFLHAKTGYTVKTDAGLIFNEKWLMYENPKTGELSPSRTYGGNNYYGGFSDHLPIYCSFQK